MTDRGSMSRSLTMLGLCLFHTALAGCGSAPPTTTLGSAPPTTSLGTDVERLRSAVLQETWECLEDAMAALQDEAPGMQPLDPREPEHGNVGRTYVHSFHRLVTGPVGAALYRLVFDELDPAPIDASFYVTIRLRADDGAMLDDESPPPDEELAAQRAFFERLQHCTRTQPLVYTAQTGWADAVGSRHDGYLIVDADSSEALWVRLEESWSP